MKNQYAGDVGDLSKFAILRTLQASMPGKRLGLLWYLTPDEKDSSDGGLINYAQLKSCDPELFNGLQNIANSRPRCIDEFARQSLLDGITAHDEILDLAAVPLKERETHRRDWFERALAVVRSEDIVLLDPDNGLASEIVRPTQARSNKYVLFSELHQLHRAGKDVILYQHATRRGAFKSQLEDLINTVSVDAFALRWHRFQCRGYIIWPARNGSELRAWGESLVIGCWKDHFSLVNGKVNTFSRRDNS